MSHRWKNRKKNKDLVESWEREEVLWDTKELVDDVSEKARKAFMDSCDSRTFTELD